MVFYFLILFILHSVKVQWLALNDHEVEGDASVAHNTSRSLKRAVKRPSMSTAYSYEVRLEQMLNEYQLFLQLQKEGKHEQARLMLEKLLADPVMAQIQEEIRLAVLEETEFHQKLMDAQPVSAAQPDKFLSFVLNKNYAILLEGDTFLSRRGSLILSIGITS